MGFLIEVQLIYSIVLVSGVEQSDQVYIYIYIYMYIYVYSLKFFSITVYYKVLGLVLCGTQ